ncbi:hypothetical protein PAPYR_13419 [Paratrimastix pyriformis]|uniref:FACT complex subunit SPT16 N-terminal lobe domain-containing protein n=1 Tax=Paratrimastix pyriformis TaxID=342808 RepID=A0ABQ8U2G9_9EUKA|nr:hypothetical protein PAPYR_13419 [Paratrimastix pyriformis]
MSGAPQNTPPPAPSATAQLDVRPPYISHYRRLLDFWAGHSDLFMGSHALFFASPENMDYSKTLAMQSWLFSYEFPKTMFMTSPASCRVYTSGKKAVFPR